MPIIDSILRELEQEAATTRRVLERVPENKLAWKPHEKSMSLGLLAVHLATIPGHIAAVAVVDKFDRSGFKGPREPASHAELMDAFAKSLAEAKDKLGAMDDAALMQSWTLTDGDKVMVSMPRVGVIRFIMLNHSYHHRGQLSVYLRLLGVPVPSIYGPSADENPFG